MSTNKVTTAVCDAEAFYPLRSLVEGPFNTLDELAAIERFVRTIVLHDEIFMELAPHAYEPDADPGFTDEEMRAGRRFVITAFGPVLDDFSFFAHKEDVVSTPGIEISAELSEVAKTFANAGLGNPYFESHMSFLNSVLSTVHGRGSALLASEFGIAAMSEAEKFPGALFDRLDQDWQEFAVAAKRERLGVLVPPVLGIVLSRCEKREAIPEVIRDLRAEWAGARNKVWQQLDALRKARTVSEAEEIRLELSKASSLFSPKKAQALSRPVRIFWDVIAHAGSGSAVAALSGGNPVLGAVTGGVGQLLRTVPAAAQDIGPPIFRRGAFDLANRVRRQTSRVNPGSLAKLLSPSERRTLGIP